MIIYLFHGDFPGEILDLGSWTKYFTVIFLTLYVLTIIFTISILILERNRPTKTLAWILVLIALPLLGLILYLFFGYNHRKDKIFNKKEVWDVAQIQKWQKEQLKSWKENSDKVRKSFKSENKVIYQNISLILNNSRAIFSSGNKVKILPGGPEKLDELLEDLNRAEHHIHLEYYIFQDGEFGNAIKEVLVKKARDGVEVRFLYDSVGSWPLSSGFRNELKEAGAEIGEFMPVRFPLFTSRFNYRNHRKIVIIDGKIGYTGGININDMYLLEENPWRDTHLRLEGECVKTLQVTFMLDWHFATEDKIGKNGYFPKENSPGDVSVQITASGPDTDYRSIMHAYFNAICTAKDYVFITSPYFIPSASILTALKTAALSGVDVRIIVPEEVDSKLVAYSSHSYYEELLQAGMKIFHYTPSFIHAKVMIVDDVFSSVGTANMDIRSFETNFEINTLMYDKEVTKELKKQYLEDLEKCTEIKLEDFERRPKSEKIAEALARLMAPMF